MLFWHIEWRRGKSPIWIKNDVLQDLHDVGMIEAFEVVNLDLDLGDVPSCRKFQLILQ